MQHVELNTFEIKNTLSIISHANENINPHAKRGFDLMSPSNIKNPDPAHSCK